MSTAATTGTAAATAATTSPPWTAQRVRRTALWAVAVLLGVTLIIVFAVRSSSRDAPMDPSGTGPRGARALVEVLGGHGVDVTVARSRAAALNAIKDRGRITVVVADTRFLGERAARDLVSVTDAADRLVLLGPRQDQLEAIGLRVHASRVSASTLLTAKCTTHSAIAAESDQVDGLSSRFSVTGGEATTCFPLTTSTPKPDSDEPDHGVGMVVLPAEGSRPEVVLTGFPEAFTNRGITSADHAGLALRMLGRSSDLVWFQPTLQDLAAEGDGAQGGSVWPRWLGPAGALGAVAFVLFALARGRRLGRLVPEPLPVVVRAVETTESRGRLYRRAGDRARAAAILRAGTRDRLARRLSVGTGASDEALINLVATAAGMPGAQVAARLTGPAPTDDRGFISLADDLHDLEERVRRA